MYTPLKRQLAQESPKRLGGIARVMVKGTQIHTVSMSAKWPCWQFGNQGKWSLSGLLQGAIHAHCSFCRVHSFHQQRRIWQLAEEEHRAGPSSPRVCPWRRRGACLSRRADPGQPASSMAPRRAGTHQVPCLAVTASSTPSRRDPSAVAWCSLGHRTSIPRAPKEGLWVLRNPYRTLPLCQGLVPATLREPWQLTGSSNGEEQRPCPRAALPHIPTQGAWSSLHRKPRLEQGLVNTLPGTHLKPAIPLCAEEWAYSNALTRSSANLRNKNLTAQPFHQLQPRSSVQALNPKAVCICYKHPLAKCVYSRSAQACAVPCPGQFQETRVARGCHTCLLLTAVVHACRYSPGKPYCSFLPISKLWLEIQ